MHAELMDGRVDNGLVCLDAPVPDAMHPDYARRVAAALLRLASIADAAPSGLRAAVEQEQRLGRDGCGHVDE